MSTEPYRWPVEDTPDSASRRDSRSAHPDEARAAARSARPGTTGARATTGSARPAASRASRSLGAFRGAEVAMREPGEDRNGGPPKARASQRGAKGSVDVELESADTAIDHALIRRAQAGDERAFEDLVLRNQQRAWRVARNLVPTDEDAQDLAQEAFVRVYKNLANFDFEHGFTTWLYRIVTNLAIDHLRRRRPVTSTTNSEEGESDFDLVDPDALQPSEGLEKLELADEVRATLASLAPHFQSVLVLREMEGLPCNEIATIVGATHVTVRWRLHRGRRLFQEEWERRARLREKGGDRDVRLGESESVEDDGPEDGGEFGADDLGAGDLGAEDRGWDR
jgi:RNA polymerase sigma-70 factor, ECF subfamily